MTVSTTTRWIAAITGCTTAITGVPIFSWLSALVSVLLLTGALVAGRYPHAGRDLIWFGSGVTSLWAIPVGIAILNLSRKGGSDPRVTAAALVSVLLVVTCDAVVVKDAFDQRLTTND